MSLEKSIYTKQEELAQEINSLGDWNEKYKFIIELGKNLGSFSEDLYEEKNKVTGCQSQVWLDAKIENNVVIYRADSDALIVKGFLALLLKFYSGHKVDEILQTPLFFFQKIDMQKHLSMTRSNGLAKIVKQIQLYALAFKNLSFVQ